MRNIARVAVLDKVTYTGCSSKVVCFPNSLQPPYFLHVGELLILATKKSVHSLLIGGHFARERSRILNIVKDDTKQPFTFLSSCLLIYLSRHRRTEEGGRRSFDHPPLFGHFVKDFKFHFYQYSPTPQSRLPSF